MSLQTVTLHLPEAFYQKIAQRAQQKQRTVEEELVAVVTATLPDVNALPKELAEEMAQLTSLSDEELQQAAQATLPWQATETMQALMHKRQREGLTTQEAQEAEQLAQRSERLMLIRAKAAVLLQERGHKPELPKPLGAL